MSIEKEANAWAENNPEVTCLSCSVAGYLAGHASARAKIAGLTAELEAIKTRTNLELLIKGHMDAMRPLLEQWSKEQGNDGI